MKKSIILLSLFVAIAIVNGQNLIPAKQKVTSQKRELSKSPEQKAVLPKDTIKKNIQSAVLQDVQKDTVKNEVLKVKLYKENAHASYYADKFNGQRTTSGEKFDNNKYTAAHKKFPFGTKLKVTNEANGKSVIVEVNDRGPFVKSREIDLSKRAFMEIAKNKGVGVMTVTIEEVIK